MNIRLFATVAVIALAPAAAFAQGSTVGGAVGGAVIGGAVGGPVGAVIGAGVGSTVGMAAEPPQEVVTYVQKEDIPTVTVQEKIVVGEALPASVELRTIPKYTQYRYAVVNKQRVIVDPQSRKVIKIIQ